MPRDLSLAALLSARRRSRGGDPLLTYYDLGSGERTELSGITFGNWVDKTANLLLDADVDPGDPVGLDLVATRPGHWISLVWCAAVWQVGGVVSLQPDGSDVAVRVIGPDAVDDPPTADLVLACSLHPFGLGFTPPLPASLADYGVEVRGFPDAFVGLPAEATGWAVTGADGDPDARLLVRPGEPRATVRRTLLRPLRGVGSSVVVVGEAAAERLAALAATERTLSSSSDI